jgi:hypothetical protein
MIFDSADAWRGTGDCPGEWRRLLDLNRLDELDHAADALVGPGLIALGFRSKERAPKEHRTTVRRKRLAAPEHAFDLRGWKDARPPGKGRQVNGTGCQRGSCRALPVAPVTVTDGARLLERGPSPLHGHGFGRPRLGLGDGRG